MSQHTITGTYTSMWNLDESDQTWTIARHALLGGPQSLGGSMFESLDQSNNHIVVKGTIDCFASASDKSVGVYLAGTNTRFVVDTTGLVKADHTSALMLTGTQQSLINTGKIVAGQTAVAVVHKAFLENDGLIKGDYGIVSSYEEAQIRNEGHGRIVADYDAITVGATAGITSGIVNDGVIKAGHFSLLGGDGNEVLDNNGIIAGKISFGAGDDSFDNRGGTIHGKILGGMGNDILITDDAATRLTERAGAGHDLVRSTVSYTLNGNVENLELLGHNDTTGKGNALANYMLGNSGDNVLYGKAGSDVLIGAGGNDLLFGGASSDAFVFATGSGKDVIADFTNGVDYIKLSDLTAATDFADLKAHHLKVSGDDLVIHYGQDSITISNTDKADLDATDFQF